MKPFCLEIFVNFLFNNETKLSSYQRFLLEILNVTFGGFYVMTSSEKRHKKTQIG